MILDSSVVIALVTNEPEAEILTRAAQSERTRMSVASWLECFVVGDRRWPPDLSALDYGDCFAYALAVTTGDTLLFKATDFTRTDVRSALG